MGDNLSPLVRWSIVIVVGVILYTGADYTADAAGWGAGMGRTLGIGASVGLIVGALAAWLGLVGDRSE